MLVLTRKPGESLMIGDDVAITILGPPHCRVRLGIDAPESVRVDRLEVWLRREGQRPHVVVP